VVGRTLKVVCDGIHDVSNKYISYKDRYVVLFTFEYLKFDSKRLTFFCVCVCVFAIRIAYFQ
jgi:hypothetical protein